MQTTAPDPEHLARRAELVERLSARLKPEQIITDEVALAPYESDGLTAYRQRPMIAVLPADTAEVQAVMRACHELALPIVPRGAGTSLSGGALPQADQGLAMISGRLRA